MLLARIREAVQVWLGSSGDSTVAPSGDKEWGLLTLGAQPQALEQDRAQEVEETWTRRAARAIWG